MVFLKGLDGTRESVNNVVSSWRKQSCIVHAYIMQCHFCSFPTDLDAAQANKNHQDVRSYVRQLNVIDNQRTLSQMSHRLEPRRP